MKILRLVAALAIAPLLPGAAAAAPSCSVSPVGDLLGGKLVTAAMQVSNTGVPCGEVLWLQANVIPFTELQIVVGPHHGILDLTDPTHFAFIPNDGYAGADTFTLLALGNNAAGGAVSGRLRVNVTINKAAP